MGNVENVVEANSCSYDNGVNIKNNKKVSDPEGTNCCVETGINDCCNNNYDDANKNYKEMESNRYKTFANMMKSDTDEIENKLNLIPLCVEDRREVVIFDEELVKEGSRKWSLTLCGHFIGYKMSYYELRYNLVFGHAENTCGLKSRNECNAEKGVWNKKNDEEGNGFRKIRYGNKTTTPTTNMESSHNLRSSNEKEKATQSPKRSVSPWRISKENIEELRRSANKFSILEEIHNYEDPVE
ncbi:hypothetical protein Tco_0700390 [Tanacetum coccineum]